jgi:hypothetical protein
MGRMLAVAERQVDAAARGDYLTSVGARQHVAASSGVHFWVFEHAEESGRFIEFVEGASERDVRAVAVDGELLQGPLALWREVRGG